VQIQGIQRKKMAQKTRKKDHDCEVVDLFAQRSERLPSDIMTANSDFSTTPASQKTGSRAKKAYHFCVRSIWALCFALSIWIVLANLYMEPKNAEAPVIFGLIFLAIGAVLFFPKQLVWQTIKWLSSHRRVCLGIALAVFVIGLAARFGFLVFDYVPRSDPRQFFLNASSLAQNGTLELPLEIAKYPYLLAYNLLLSFSLKLAPGLSGIIVLNTLSDIVASLLMSQLVWSLTEKRMVGIFAALIWWISPFNIIFCAISLPVIVVNMLILASLTLLVYLFKNLSKLKTCLPLSLAVGLCLGVTDAFRPLAAVFVIAVIIWYLIYCLRHQHAFILRNCVVSAVLITVTFNAVGYGYQQLVNAVTDLPTNTHKAGWSIYVGSNYDTSGGWDAPAQEYSEELLLQNNGDISVTFEQLQQQGIARWQALGLKVPDMLFRKSVRLLGDAQNMTYNLDGSFPFWSVQERLLKLVHILCAFYWFVVLAFAVKYLFGRVRFRSLDFSAYLGISMTGLFLAYMLVEVANRYFTIFFPLFTLFAVFGLVQVVREIAFRQKENAAMRSGSFPRDS
jgi:hypothetical protein